MGMSIGWRRPKGHSAGVREDTLRAHPNGLRSVVCPPSAHSGPRSSHIPCESDKRKTEKSGSARRTVRRTGGTVLSRKIDRRAFLGGLAGVGIAIGTGGRLL